MPADSNIYLEIFGYIGSALIIISMLMTSVIKLRIFNICGAVISMIYAVFVGAYPVVLLNAALTAINTAQLFRIKFKRCTSNNNEQNNEASGTDGAAA